MYIHAFVCSNCSVDSTFTRVFLLSDIHLEDLYFIDS